MRPLCALVLFAGLVGSVPAADPAPSPFPPRPAPQPVPPPPPKVDPAAVWNLTTGTIYVVSSPVDGKLLVGPSGLVTVVKKAGPRTIDGVFADAKVPGQDESRDYAGPFLFVIKPAGKASGRVEMTFVPKGWTDEAQIVSETLDVNAGQAPPPAPKPVDPPKPDPPAPAPVSAPGAWVIVVHDETAAAPASLSGPTLAKLLKDGRGHVYGTQKDGAKIAAKKYDALLAEAGVIGPGLIVLDRLGAKVLVAPLPATDADLAAKLKGVVPGV